MAESAIVTNQLSKRYGRVLALDGVCLHLGRGIIYGLVGKSGAGKSTFLRVVSGLQDPSSGGYELFGTDCADRAIERERRRVGLVAEGWSLIPNRTVSANLKRQCRLLGLPGEKRVDEVLQLTGLTEFAAVKAENVPAEKQAVAAIAMALCGSPDLLLLDDVFAGMSAQAKNDTEMLLKQLKQEFQMTILVTSVDPEVLSNIADQFGILDHSELRRELSAEELSAMRETTLCVRVTDTNALARVLVAKSLKHRILNSDTAEIYGKPNITELVMVLAKEGCEVLCMEERNDLK